MKKSVKPTRAGPHRGDRRAASASNTRHRIIQAARKLLVSPGGIAIFTIDAVAEKAKVGRMTLYYHFRSRRGLIEAIADSLALHVHLDDLKACFACEDFPVGLDRFIAAFGEYYWTDRKLIRTLNALYMLEPEVTRLVDRRQEVRRGMLRSALLTAYPDLNGARSLADRMIATLFMLTRFECYDPLAGRDQTFADVVPLIQRLARAVLEWRSSF